jgi:transposase
MHMSSVGIDLGKTTLHLVALGEQGKVLVRKKFSRKQLLIYTAKLQPALIGIDACSGAHFIGAALRDAVLFRGVDYRPTAAVAAA